jgi:hypothetical protein
LRELAIRIGGVAIAMVSREVDLSLALRGPHQQFAAAGSLEPDIRMDVRWDSVPAGPYTATPGAQLFDSGGVWRLYREGRLLSFHLSAPKFGPLPYARATINDEFSAGTVSIRRECVDTAAPLYPLDYPLDELLVTNWLALGRGVEIHACGVVDSNGAGYLFAGYSGSGKTTTARLWCEENGVRVLSDDRIILRKDDTGVWMHGTPWHGDEPLASSACAQVQHGFFLRHGRENQLTTVTGAQAVMELFARSFPPFYSQRGLEFTLSLLTEIFGLVPFSTLEFVPDTSLLAFIRTKSSTSS